MKTTVLTFRTIIEKDGKYYHGFVPSLPGCHTQGKTMEETLKNLKEATELYLEEFPIKKISKPFLTTFEVANLVKA